MLRFPAWWLDVCFWVPVPWQGLDAVNVGVQGLHQLLLSICIVDLLDKVPVKRVSRNFCCSEILILILTYLASLQVFEVTGLFVWAN